MSRRGFITVALMMFAFFFGAGNLIFPPFAGLQTGKAFGQAYAGYILVDVGLSLLAIIAVSIAGRASFLTVDLPKWMSVTFWLVIYLIIGPVFAVPRTSVVSYDIGISPFMTGSSSIALLIFSFCFFAMVLVLVFYPGRLVHIIGGFLTPLLLLFLLILYSVMFFAPHEQLLSPVLAHGQSAFGYGLLQGYLTMDTLAALAFGAVIAKAVRVFGVSDDKDVVKMTVYIAALAGCLLAIVYLGLFYMGAINPEMAGVMTNGGQVLAAFVGEHLGFAGQVILALIIILACITTAVGLITSCAEYFNFLYQRVSYQMWAVLLCIISFCLANLGLDRIITLSIPVVVALYPITILFIFTALVRKFAVIDHRIVIFNCCFTLVFSILDAIHSIIPKIFENTLLVNIPFFTYELSWLVPSIIVFVLGVLISNLWLKPSMEIQKG